MAEKFLRRAMLAAGTGRHGTEHRYRPLLRPVADGVTTTSLTVNDAGSTNNGYKLVGVPNGIGPSLTLDVANLGGWPRHARSG